MKLPLPSRFTLGNFGLAFIIFVVSGTILYTQRFNLEQLVRVNLNGPLSFMQDWRLTEWLGQYAWGPFAAMLGYFVYWFRGSRRQNQQPMNLHQDIAELRTDLAGLREDLKIMATAINLVREGEGGKIIIDEHGAMKVLPYKLEEAPLQT